VLATCLFGGRVGLATSAALLPQPWTQHAEDVLRCGLKAGLAAVPCRSLLRAALYLWSAKRPRDFVIGPGGMGLEGTTAYMSAAREVLAQARAMGSPLFDYIFVAAGSGSTAAGLLAGVVAENVPTRVVAVAVADNPGLRLTIVGQALHALRKQGVPIDRRRLWRALRIERGFVGKGYGQAVSEGDRAMEVARSFGLSLDPTYTAKAFAAVLQASAQTSWPRQGAKLGLCARETYLYWHTLSSAPLTHLIEGAPRALPSELAELLPGPHPADTVSAALG
jgi:D-cysteine desulfhydrase